MYNLYPPAALGKGGSITQGSHHRPIRSGQEEEEKEEKEEEEKEEELEAETGFWPRTRAGLVRRQ